MQIIQQVNVWLMMLVMQLKNTFQIHYQDIVCYFALKAIMQKMILKFAQITALKEVMLMILVNIAQLNALMIHKLMVTSMIILVFINVYQGNSAKIYLICVFLNALKHLIIMEILIQGGAYFFVQKVVMLKTIVDNVNKLAQQVNMQII